MGHGVQHLEVQSHALREEQPEARLRDERKAAGEDGGGEGPGRGDMSSTKPAAWCQRDKELLEIVQKRAVRMISGLRSDTKAD